MNLGTVRGAHAPAATNPRARDSQQRLHLTCRQPIAARRPAPPASSPAPRPLGPAGKAALGVGCLVLEKSSVQLSARPRCAIKPPAPHLPAEPPSCSIPVRANHHTQGGATLTLSGINAFPVPRNEMSLRLRLSQSENVKAGCCGNKGLETNLRSDLCLRSMAHEAQKCSRARAQHRASRAPKHSKFSFIWFFTTLAQPIPLLQLFPHMDNICLLFTQLAAMHAPSKTLLLFVYTQIIPHHSII